MTSQICNQSVNEWGGLVRNPQELSQTVAQQKLALCRFPGKLHENLDKITEHKILLLALINFQSLILNVGTFTLITKMVTNDVKDSKSRDAVSIIPFTVFAISSLWLYL